MHTIAFFLSLHMLIAAWVGLVREDILHLCYRAARRTRSGQATPGWRLVGRVCVSCVDLVMFSLVTAHIAINYDFDWLQPFAVSVFIVLWAIGTWYLWRCDDLCKTIEAEWEGAWFTPGWKGAE